MKANGYLRGAAITALVLLVQGAVVAATVTIDASKPLGPNPHFERYNTIQRWISGDTEVQLLKDLGTTHIRGIRSANSIAMVDATPITNIWGFPSSLSGYEDDVYNHLKEYKERFPQLEHCEIMNEPDGSWYHGGYKSPEQYMDVFKAGVRAVERINDEITGDLPKIKIGGPVTYKWNPSYLYDVLDIVVRDNVKFDFVVWHEYHVRNNPAAIRSRTREMVQKLAELGLDDVEIIITEWGIEPGGNDSDPSSGELLESAAFVASGNYYFMDGGADIVCQWVVRHEKNRVKSQFAGSSGTGKVYPYYNMLKMMSMMKDTRVQETIDGMNSNGIGIGGWGTYDETGIAALLWNYHGNTEDATIEFPNLPSAFQTGPFTVKTYLIDDTHSNYKHDSNNDRLEMVDETTENPTGEYATTVSMKENSIVLVVLEPTGEISMGNYEPTAKFAVSGDGNPAPCEVSVDASESSDFKGSITDYAWDFGDGSTGSGVTATHTYTTNNTYTITLTVTDDSGATDAATQSVYIGEEPPQAYFVVGDVSLSSGDALVKTRMENLGYTVEAIDDNAASASAASEADIVLVSSSTTSSNVGSALNACTAPMVVWETWLFDDMGMSGTSQDVDFGNGGDITSIEVADPGHDIADGLSGTVEVGTQVGFGVPGGEATIVATLSGDDGKAAVYAYEEGASMVSGTAPNRRVGFFLNDATGGAMTDEGWRMFEAAIRWATGNSNATSFGRRARTTSGYAAPIRVRALPGGLAIHGVRGHSRILVHDLRGRTVASLYAADSGGIPVVKLPRGLYTVTVDEGSVRNVRRVTVR